MRSILIILVLFLIAGGVYFLLPHRSPQKTAKQKENSPNASPESAKPAKETPPNTKAKNESNPSGQELGEPAPSVHPPASPTSPEEQEKQFAEKMSAKGFVEINGKWLTPEEKAEMDKILETKTELENGLVEYQGKKVTAQEKESLSFQEEMEQKGYVWNRDRWMKKGEKHPFDPNLKPEVLQPPTHTVDGKNSAGQPVTGTILLQPERCFLKYEDDQPYIYTIIKTDLPVQSIILLELSHYCEPDSVLVSIEVKISEGKNIQKISAAIGPFGNGLPKGIWLVTCDYNPLIQKEAVVEKAGNQSIKNSAVFINGTKEELITIVDRTVPKLESIIAALDGLYLEMKTAYKEALAKKDAAEFTDWSKQWLNRVSDIRKSLPSNQSKSNLPPPFIQTERGIEAFISNMILLCDKYERVLGNESLRHSLEDKYVSESTVSKYSGDAKQLLVKDRQIFESILKTE